MAKISKGKRLVYTLLTLAIFLVFVEGLSYVLIAIVPGGAPLRTARIYKDQSMLIRSFIDPSAKLHSVMHPVLGWYTKTSFRSATYNTNSQALRGIREYSPVPGAGVLRVAVFGSSIVECSEVDDANSWPQLIEAANPDMEVLNYGVAGYGSDQAYLRYLAEGTKLTPKIVLLGFTSDELGRTVNVYRRFISPDQGPQFKPRFRREPNGLFSLIEVPVKTRADYERLLEDPAAVIPFGKNDYWYQAGIYENPLYDYFASMRMITWMSSQLKHRVVDGNRLVIGKIYNDNSEAFQIQLALFQEFSKAVRSAGALPLIVLLPEKESVERAFDGGNKLYDPLLPHLRERGIDYVDAIAAFEGARGTVEVKNWYAPFGHYSPAGNKVVADWLSGQIKQFVAKQDQPSQ